MRGARGVLLDTCAIVWLANKDRMARSALKAIDAASREKKVFVSPISGWEIAMLSQRWSGSRKTAMFAPDAEQWFRTFLSFAPVSLVKLDLDIALEGGLLPTAIHGDPCDRLLMATARRLTVPLVTRDTRLIAYGEAGYVEVVEC